jgi:hypothetical protein
MYVVGTGPAVRSSKMLSKKDGEKTALEFVPIKLDMGCRSVVNCVQFAWGGWSAIPPLVIERRI